MVPTQPDDQVVSLVRRLLEYPRETEWLEDKANNTDPTMIGERLSALSNSAALADHPRGFMLWGIRDEDRVLIGTSFKPFQQKVGNEDLQNWLLHSISPQIHFEFHEVVIDDHNIVVLEIDRPITQPVKFKGFAYIRIGSHTKKLSSHPDHERRLWRRFDQTPFEDGTAIEHISSSDVLSLLDYPSHGPVVLSLCPLQA